MPINRRQFLALAGAAAASALAPPTPIAPVTAAREPHEYFVPLEDYHELPEDCYQPNLIRPLEVIVHWDGNTRGRDLWLAPVTYQTLAYLKQSSHFAVDYKRVWQLLPMYRTRVQESHGARGFNWKAVNVELAGANFDQPDNAPPESEVRLAVGLVSRLLDFYGLAPASVFGHFERDERGLKLDPGVEFMAAFREALQAYRASLSPLKTRALGE